MRTLATIALIACLAAAASAQVEFSSPVDGYCRAGKFMPLRLRTAAAGSLEILPEGGIPTQMPLAGGQVDAIVPVLTMDVLRQVRYRMGDASGFADLQWRPLTSEQRLVGFLGPVDLRLGRELFPDNTVVPVRVSGPLAMAGSAAAWNVLDAIVFDGVAPDDERTGQLLAAGISVAIRAPDKPAGRWKWQKLDNAWTVKAELLGPTQAGENQPAMAPVQAWAADWPKPFRRRILLYAGLFIVLALASTLLPRRWAVVALIVLSASASGLLVHWAKQNPVVLRKTGVVLVRGEPGQEDRWTYFAASNPGPASMPFDTMTLPLFQGRLWPLAGLTLTCDGAGRPTHYAFEMRPGVKVGFVTRSCGTSSAGVPRPLDPLDPLYRLADRAYLRPGASIAGGLPGTGPSLYEEDRGTVVIDTASVK